MRIYKYFIIFGSSVFIYLLIIIGFMTQNNKNLLFHETSRSFLDHTVHHEFSKNLSVMRESFNRSKLINLKFASENIQTYDNDSSCTALNISLSEKTLFESDNISILPRHHLKARRTNLIPAICFYRGNFIPIHGGHINVLQETKQYIDNLGTHELLAIYISPSHSKYVAKKLNPEEITGIGHRLSMIYLAIKNLNWAMVDLFELFQTCNTKPLTIMKSLISRVYSQLSHGARIDVFWLTDENSLDYSELPDEIIRLGFQPIYIINRSNSSNQFEFIENHNKKRSQDIQVLPSFRFHRIHITNMNLSSSHIRTCAHDSSVTREQLQICTRLNTTTAYILQHHLWSTSVNVSSTIVPTLSEFPNTNTSIISEFLSHVLSVYSNTSIKIISFKLKEIGKGKGFTSRLVCLYNIQYSSNNTDDLPQRLILKMSKTFPKARFVANEPNFYLNFGSRISNIKIPKYYYVARHLYSPSASLLLLEDLSINYVPLGSGNSLNDSTVFSVIASIASLHAEFFKHPLLQHEAFAWLPSLNSTLKHFHDAYKVRMADDNFMKNFKSNVSHKAYIYTEELLAHLPYLLQRLSNEYYTLSHGDIWYNNVFRSRNQPHDVLLLDWQNCCRANGLIDIVSFLRTLNMNHVRSLESQALELYHQVLVKYGISQYELNKIREDYYSLALPYMFIIYYNWQIPIENGFNQMVMILEDIVSYNNKFN